uniref:Uncharacterized protein n=1 Tax=Avena sativa TaxID=4498 RepID=A0ACD5W173_AVESA
MDGNSALWLKAYRLRHKINTWPELMAAVTEKFGYDDYRKYLKQLLALKQKGTVQEYHQQFEALSYNVSIQNPHYDEHFFVSQIIRGLKSDIRGAVKAPSASISGEGHTFSFGTRSASRSKSVGSETSSLCVCGGYGTKTRTSQIHTEDWPRGFLVGQARRANGLCFKCGENYEPTHQCAKKPGAEVHAAQLEEQAEMLSEEVLNLIEKQDLAFAEQLSLSIHAMAGTEGAETLKLWAMVGNQVLLFLVDSGSSHNFVNANLVDRLKCSVQQTKSIPVKIANGSYMHCSQMVQQLTWWCQGETFSTDMRVLELGAYDAILGMDWLHQHSPMVTDWINHCLAFSHKGKPSSGHDQRVAS